MDYSKRTTNTLKRTADKKMPTSQARTFRKKRKLISRPGHSYALQLRAMIQEEKGFYKSVSDHNPHHHQVWRERVAQWGYDVVDCLSLSRELVYIAMGILDRNLTEKQLSKDDYEMTAISSFYLAVCITSSSPISVQKFLLLTASRFMVGDIRKTIHQIVKRINLLTENGSCLEWNRQNHRTLIQLTPQAFCKMILLNVDLDSHETRLRWLEMSLYLIELSVYDGTFCKIVPSSLALASLLVAKQLISHDQESHFLMNDLGITCNACLCNSLEYFYRKSQDKSDHKGPNLIVDYFEE